MRYVHPHVLMIMRVVLNVFDVRTGKIMKGFNERADEFAFGETGGFTGVSWPVFR
uniref:Uncharacterized protein n=1 Tax=Helianthus annuus TaxID=4232 RepID=A0A251U7U2_HELAN